MKTIEKIVSFALPVGIFIGILLSFSHYIPMWDSRSYFTSFIFPAMAKPFALLSYNCANHGALAFGLLYSASHHIDFGNPFLIHLTSLVFLGIACCFLYKLLMRLFHSPLWAGIGMALICWNPALLANAINPTPDLMVLGLSWICLWCFLTHRLWYASLVGLIMLFSKESGCIYYGLACLIYLLVFHFNKLSSPRFIIKNALLLSWPWMLYAWFMWYKTHIAHEHLLFGNMDLFSLLKNLYRIDFSNAYFYSALLAMFVLNFQWLIVGIIFGGTFFSSELFRKQSDLSTNKPWDREIIFLTLLTISLTYILSRFPHFSNVRYYLPVFPLTAMLALFVLKKLGKKIGAPIGALVALLFLTACFRTIDPVAQSIYGTFQFGNHALLRMTSITQECCEFGRDQLIYNLEYTQFQKLLEKFSRKVRLEKNDVLLTNPYVNYFIYANISNDNYGWTLKEENTHTPLYADDPIKLKQSLSNLKANRIYFPAFANTANSAFAKKVFTLFKPIANIELENAGYHLTVVQLEPR